MKTETLICTCGSCKIHDICSILSPFGATALAFSPFLLILSGSCSNMLCHDKEMLWHMCKCLDFLLFRRKYVLSV